ncbi:MAG: metallophosphoesterase [Acidobacteriota bacterium]
MRDWLLGIVVLVGGCAVGLRIDADHLAIGWRYALGSPSESLRASAGDMPSARASVTLPHRLLHPNRAMWYARTLTLPRQPALRIDADDGAQVFVDEVQWLEDGRTFVPGEPVTPGSHAVVVRVLNNAMEGGLRSVAIVQRPRERQRSALPAVLPSGFDPVESAAFRNRMPLPGRPCRFTLWADSQGGLHTFAALIAKMASAPQDFSAGVGDLVDNGSDPAAWTRFVETLAPLARRVPLVPILGNHDYDGFYGDLISLPCTS